nr:hypothetical protein Iba_chr08fCG1960 [Ipomoea batatas]GMD87447.1 hypothetical protein Iba_chr14bCG15830 [Ipomoea batatas]
MKNPRVWPAMAAKNTPPLNDITASITMYASPILTAYTAVSSSPAATWLPESSTPPRFDTHSTRKARAKTTSSDRIYIPKWSYPGQPEKSTSAFLPQKNVMCIMWPYLCWSKDKVLDGVRN